MIDYLIDLALIFKENNAYIFDNGPESFCYHINGDIVLTDDDLEVTEKIGSFQATIVNAEASVLERNSLFYLFDHDAEIYRYFESLYGAGDEIFTADVQAACGEFCLFSPNLLVIDDLVVNPDHRGHGVELLALRTLMQRLGMGVNLVALAPFFSHSDSVIRTDATEQTNLALGQVDVPEFKVRSRIQAYFGRLGFKRVPGSDIMVRSLEHPLPPVESLLPTAGVVD